jgi:hypothetical protein
MRLVLSSAILQFCRPYSVLAHTRGDNSSPESTIAHSRESAMFNSAHTSAEELSILCRADTRGIESVIGQMDLLPGSAGNSNEENAMEQGR